MKILVAISNVPDTTTKIQFTDGDTKFNAAGVTFVINPYDEWYALVRALELKEANLAEKVTLIHVGLADSEATIRKGFALGADDAVRIDAESPDAFFVAASIETNRALCSAINDSTRSPVNKQMPYCSKMIFCMSSKFCSASKSSEIGSC
ncbi:MAG: hypothetical protein EBU33_03770 [Sphingobacteriia bacterium]|nr:hypothetical protein [Sphingobacteriia bacterium]